MTSSAMTRILRLCSAAGLAISAHWAAPAWAAGAMTTGGLTSQPIGHYDFCKARPNECNIHPADLEPARMTDGLWRKLVSVSAKVNAAVKPLSDLDHYGKDEVWAYPDDGYGDCEDYVLEKRKALVEQGVPGADLSIAVVMLRTGVAHAVLLVATDRGEMVMDSLSSWIVPWNQLDYRWISRQAPGQQLVWVKVAPAGRG